jgi:tetratricopeptide (TPR) repeat protein
VQLKPDSTKGLLALAHTYDRPYGGFPVQGPAQSRLKAIALYRKVLALDPRATEALTSLAVLLSLRRSGEPVTEAELLEAEELAKRAVAITPDCSTRKVLATVYEKQRYANVKSPSAIPFLTKSLAACTTDWYAAKNFPLSLAKRQEEAGDLALAEQNYCKAATLGNYDALDDCLKLRASHGPTGSVEKYEPGIDWLGHFMLGMSNSKSASEQLQHLEKAAELNPSARMIHSELASAYRTRNDHARACTELKRAYQLGIQRHDGGSSFNFAFDRAEAETTYRVLSKEEHCE